MTLNKMTWSKRADQRVVSLVVEAFRSDVEDLRGMLMPISLQQWQESYYWLDASGMALYLFRRLEELGLSGLLPAPVLARLVQNLADNIERSAVMFREFKELNRAFRSGGIDYCNLKGFTLIPDSCPDPSLRIQLDFDFLVDGGHLPRCCEVLSTFGYKVRASTNTVFELKTESNQIADISSLYKPREQRSVELHFSCTEGPASQPARDYRLQDTYLAQFDGIAVPALSPIDQLIGQATHILSHLCGPSTRLAWLLEFANHLTLRFGDRPFLNCVLQRLRPDRDAEIAVGAICLLVRNLFGCPIPELLRSGPVHNLPRPIELWINRYGVRAVLADFPGTKLYLLLREQLESDPDTWRGERRKALLPNARPPRVLPLKAGANIRRHVVSELYQIRYDLFRLRFHVVQGLAYLREARRWRQFLTQQGLSLKASTSLPSEAVPSR